MSKQLQIEPVRQIGSKCKSVAIAAIDKYYGKEVGFEPIALHKNKSRPISIRELAKTKGSLQGELLEIRQIPEIFTDIGYETEVIDFQDDPKKFQQTIVDNINKGNLIIGFFNVFFETKQPKVANVNQSNEHAAVIHGYDLDKQVLTMTHWGESMETSMDDFYKSSMLLAAKRSPEYYINVKERGEDGDKERKYQEIFTKSLSKYPQARKSIVPEPGTGFKGKLIVIKKPELEHILEARKNLLGPSGKKRIVALMDELQIKTNELIKKGNKRIKGYVELVPLATELNEKLGKLKQALVIDRAINFDDFQQQCYEAIQKVEPHFQNHRGWHTWNKTARALLGILAVITVLPALVIQLNNTNGYVGTFFDSPKTDASKKAEAFVKGIEQERLVPK